MDSAVLTDQIVKSLSFEVEAAPQKDSMFITSASNGVPVDIKIRVKRKKDAETKNIGFLSRVVKTRNKKRIRLVSSDQTIMSFNMLIETDDFDVDQNLNSRKYLFGVVKPGGCLDPKVEDEDDRQYLASSSKIKAGVENSLQHNKANSDIVLKDNRIKESISPLKLHNKSGKTIFGKCKPGGCLDPHGDDEDKDSYKLVNTNTAGKKEKPINIHSNSKENIPVFRNYKTGGCLDPPFEEQKDVFKRKEPIHPRVSDSELNVESNTFEKNTNEFKHFPKEPINPRVLGSDLNAQSCKFEEKTNEYKPLTKEPIHPQVSDSKLTAQSNKLEEKNQQNIPSGQFEISECKKKRSSIFNGKLFRKKKNNAEICSKELKIESKIESKYAHTRENSISNSIITYPPDLSPSEILDTTEQESSQPIEVIHAYYSPPRRSSRNKDEEYNRSEITTVPKKNDKNVNEKIEPTISTSRKSADECNFNTKKGKNQYDNQIDKNTNGNNLNQHSFSMERQIRLSSTPSANQKDVDIVDESIVTSKTHSPVTNDLTEKLLTESHSLTAIIQTNNIPSSTIICIRSKTQVQEANNTLNEGSTLDLKIVHSISRYRKERDNNIEAKVEKPISKVDLESQVGDDQNPSKLISFDSNLLFSQSQNHAENSDDMKHDFSDATKTSLPCEKRKSQKGQHIKNNESLSSKIPQDNTKGQNNIFVENENIPVTPNTLGVREPCLLDSVPKRKSQNDKDTSRENVPFNIPLLEPILPRNKIKSRDNVPAENINIPDLSYRSEEAEPVFFDPIKKSESQKVQSIDRDELSSEVPPFRSMFPGDSENVNNSDTLTLSRVKEPHMMNSIEDSKFTKHTDINNRKSGQDYNNRSSLDKQTSPEYIYDVENLIHPETSKDNLEYTEMNRIREMSTKELHRVSKKSFDISPSFEKSLETEENYFPKREVEDEHFPIYDYDTVIRRKSLVEQKITPKELNKNEMIVERAPSLTLENNDDITFDQFDLSTPDFTFKKQSQSDDREGVQEFRQQTMLKSTEEFSTSSNNTQNKFDELNRHFKSSNSIFSKTETKSTDYQFMIDPNLIHSDKIASRSSISNKNEPRSDKYLGKNMFDGPLDSSNKIILTDDKKYYTDLKTDITQINQKSYDKTKYYDNNSEAIFSDPSKLVEPSQKTLSPNIGRLTPTVNVDSNQKNYGITYNHEARSYANISNESPQECADLVNDSHEKSERHRSLQWQEQNAADTLPSKKIDMLELNLSFRNYTDEKGKRIFKTLDSSTIPLSQTKDITTFRTGIKRYTSLLSLKIDVDDNVSLMFFNNSSSKFETLPKAQLGSNNTNVSFKSQTDKRAFDAEIDQCSPNQIVINRSSIIKEKRDLNQNEVHKTLSSIYEEELVPLKNTIKSLKNEIDNLAKRQKLLRDRLIGVRKAKSVRLIRVNKHCECNGHKNYSSVYENY